MSYPAFADLSTAAATPGSGLSGLAAYAHRFFALSAADGLDERRGGVVVAGDYFGVLGVRPALGRLLTPADDRPGAGPGVVLSDALWRQRFGGDPAVVGREVRLNGGSFEIIGVTPPAFRGLVRERHPDLWVTAHAWYAHAPSSYARLSIDRRSWSWLRAFGRLALTGEQGGGAGGVWSVDKARGRLVAEAQRQMAVFPDDSRDNFDQLVLTSTSLAAIGVLTPGVARTIALALSVLVALLMALAVSSAAHIFLARGEARRPELATRLALGASRRQITALLLAEPLVTSLVASALAITLASVALDALADEVLPGAVRLGDLGLAIDWRVAAVGVSLALIAGFVAGWIPARRLHSDDLARSLGSSRAVSAGKGSRRIRRALTAAQVAISLLLVAATALATRALSRASALESGYEGSGLGFVGLDAGLARLSPEAAQAAYAQAVQAVAVLPGIAAVSITSELPLDSDSSTESFELPGHERAPGDASEVEVALVGPEALSVLGIGLRTGREIEASDVAGGEMVAVASASFVDRYLRGRDPLGVRIALVGREVRVVGVADDVQANAPGAPLAPKVYLALAQGDAAYTLQPLAIVYRTLSSLLGDGAEGSSAVVDPQLAVQRAVAEAVPGVPVVPIGSFDRLLAAALAPQRFAAALFGAFSLIATALAAVGLFGLVAHAAAARTRELGLRAALGAQSPSLVALLLRTTFTPVVVGMVVGAAAALTLAVAARGLMTGFEDLDFAAVAWATMALAVTALLAALIPAWRGARLEPIVALRAE